MKPGNHDRTRSENIKFPKVPLEIGFFQGQGHPLIFALSGKCTCDLSRYIFIKTFVNAILA